MSILKLAAALENRKNGTASAPVNDPPSIADAIVSRLESELATANAALNRARERAEDAEADLAETKKGLAKELGEETERANELEIANQELTAKIDKLENAAAIEGHKLTDAYRKIGALRKYNAAQKTVVEELRAKLFPVEGSSPTFTPRRNKPWIAAPAGHDPSDADPRPHPAPEPVSTADSAPESPANSWEAAQIAQELIQVMSANATKALEPKPAPQQSRPVRQMWNLKTRQWQPA